MKTSELWFVGECCKAMFLYYCYWNILLFIGRVFKLTLNLGLHISQISWVHTRWDAGSEPCYCKVWTFESGSGLHTSLYCCVIPSLSRKEPWDSQLNPKNIILKFNQITGTKNVAWIFFVKPSEPILNVCKSTIVWI